MTPDKATNDNGRAKTRGKPKWLNYCIKGEKGNPLPILANALLALRVDPRMNDSFAYDEMLCAPMLMRYVGVNFEPNFKPRPLTDTDVGYVQEWLQRAGLK